MQRFVCSALLPWVNSSRGTLSLGGFFFCRVFSSPVPFFRRELRWVPRNSLTSMNGGLETVMISKRRSRVCKLTLENKFKTTCGTNIEQEFLCIQLAYLLLYFPLVQSVLQLYFFIIFLVIRVSYSRLITLYYSLY